jgi:hypothetical protein
MAVRNAERDHVAPNPLEPSTVFGAVSQADDEIGSRFGSVDQQPAECGGLPVDGARRGPSASKLAGRVLLGGIEQSEYRLCFACDSAPKSRAVGAARAIGEHENKLPTTDRGCKSECAISERT